MHRVSWLALALLLASLMAACGGSRYGNPESALHAYARALQDGRAEEAYALLSDSARRTISKESFLRLAKEHPEEVREIAQALLRPATEPHVSATVTTSAGYDLELVLEGGRWRIESSAVDFYAQDTPRHTIQGFARALERKRYDVVLRFVPDAHREGLDAGKLKASWDGPEKEHMEHVLAALKQILPMATIEQTGERASMPYGAGTMALVRERGLWKIEDFD